MASTLCTTKPDAGPFWTKLAFVRLRRPDVSDNLVSENVTIDLPVIVVDDDPLLVRTLAGNLEDAGISTRTFTEGGAAVEWFNHGGRAAAVMLDWHMPALDGMAVLRRLRTAGVDSPILFLTGHSQPIYEEAALGGGAVD